MVFLVGKRMNEYYFLLERCNIRGLLHPALNFPQLCPLFFLYPSSRRGYPKFVCQISFMPGVEWMPREM